MREFHYKCVFLVGNSEINYSGSTCMPRDLVTVTIFSKSKSQSCIMQKQVQCKYAKLLFFSNVGCK